MRIIGIIGPIGAGKDTIAEYLVTNYKYKKISFAARVKDVAATAFGWDRHLLEGDTFESRTWREQTQPFWGISPRQALQKIGTEMFRTHIADDFWIRIVEKQIEEAREAGVKGIVITDCRFQNEIEAVKRLGGIVMHVQREPPPEWAQDAIDGHPYNPSYKVHITEWNAWAFRSSADYLISNEKNIEYLTMILNTMRHVWN